MLKYLFIMVIYNGTTAATATKHEFTTIENCNRAERSIDILRPSDDIRIKTICIPYEQ